MTAHDRPHAIVVGAGIVGAACGAVLAREGWRVTILDRAFASAGTTSVGMGHIVAMDDSPEQLALTAYAARLWRELSPELDDRSEVDPCGTLWVAEDDGQLEAVRGKAAVYAAAGVRSELIDAKQLAGAEPNLRPGLAGALCVPDDSVVYPPGVTLRLLEWARAEGAELRERAEVLELLPNAVRTARETLRADAIINAAGTAAPSLTPAETIVCRCEDVRFGALDRTWSARQAKLYTRAGMGPCQGRICGAALECILGWPADSMRSPTQPARLDTLLIHSRNQTSTEQGAH